MERIPVIRMGSFLLVSVREEMEDGQAVALEDDLLAEIVKTSARGVLIDISALSMIDSFTGRMIGSITGATRLLGAEAVVVGMRPAVAMTIVELGVPMDNVHTALGIERGMQLLTELSARE